MLRKFWGYKRYPHFLGLKGGIYMTVIEKQQFKGGNKSVEKQKTPNKNLPVWRPKQEVANALNNLAGKNDSIPANIAETYRLLCLLGYKFNYDNVFETKKDKPKEIKKEFVDFLKKIHESKNLDIDKYISLFYEDKAKGKLNKFVSVVPNALKDNKAAIANIYGGNNFDGIVDLQHAQKTILYEASLARKKGPITTKDIDKNGNNGDSMDEFLHIREKYYKHNKFITRHGAIDTIKKKVAAIKAQKKQYKIAIDTPAKDNFAYFSAAKDNDPSKLSPEEQVDLNIRLAIMGREQKKAKTKISPKIAVNKNQPYSDDRKIKRGTKAKYKITFRNMFKVLRKEGQYSNARWNNKTYLIRLKGRPILRKRRSSYAKKINQGIIKKFHVPKNEQFIDAFVYQNKAYYIVKNNKNKYLVRYSGKRGTTWKQEKKIRGKDISSKFNIVVDKAKNKVYVQINNKTNIAQYKIKNTPPKIKKETPKKQNKQKGSSIYEKIIFDSSNFIKKYKKWIPPINKNL